MATQQSYSQYDVRQHKRQNLDKHLQQVADGVAVPRGQDAGGEVYEDRQAFDDVVAGVQPMNISHEGGEFEEVMASVTDSLAEGYHETVRKKRYALCFLNSVHLILNPLF